MRGSPIVPDVQTGYALSRKAGTQRTKAIVEPALRSTHRARHSKPQPGQDHRPIEVEE